MMALLPWRYIAAALAVLALLGFVAGYGYRHGAMKVQAKWDAQVVADKAAAETLRESNRLRAQAAATSYETQRAAIVARANKQPSQEATYALHATICPKSGVLGQPLELGDVSVPAAVLQRLRDSGADF